MRKASSLAVGTEESIREGEYSPVCAKITFLCLRNVLQSIKTYDCSWKIREQIVTEDNLYQLNVRLLRP